MLDWDLVDTALHESDTHCSNNSVQICSASAGGAEKLTQYNPYWVVDHIFYVNIIIPYKLLPKIVKPIHYQTSQS